MEIALTFKIALTGLLALSLAAGFFGPAPRRRIPAPAVHALLGLGLAAYLGAFVTLAARDLTLAAALFAAGMELMCAGAWLGRGSGGDDDEPADPPEPPFDWDEFEAQFRRWSRRPSRPPRDRVPA